jgi:uncharacterized protein YjbJ (UPF0337 family)
MTPRPAKLARIAASSRKTSLELRISNRVILVRIHNKEQVMDREHVKGAADKVKGTVKDVAGKMTDDKKMQAEGKFDKAKGEAHNVAGDVKDAVKNRSEDASHHR